MGVWLTDRQALLMSALAYIDVDQFWFPKEQFRNKTLEELFLAATRYEAEDGTNRRERRIPYNGGYTHQEFMGILEEIAKDSVLKGLIIVDYLNDNKDGNQHRDLLEDQQKREEYDYSGFVGIALKDENNNSVVLFRGSEGIKEQEVEGVSSPYLTKDWLENYRFACGGSEQLSLAVEFTKRNTLDCRELTFLTGHSKGGAIGAYVAGVLPAMTGKVFDAPGISQFFTMGQLQRLKESGLKNYVAKGDVVGALFFHAESVVFVETNEMEVIDGEVQRKYYYDDNYIDEEGERKPLTLDTMDFRDIGNFHRLQAIDFNELGEVMEGEQGCFSLAAERLSQQLYMDNMKAGNLLGELLNQYVQLEHGTRVLGMYFANRMDQ
ncbi:Mbeg1-like protein [Anaerotignum sp.]|uniref:Mbeg1-like protein n=1 Tax=Anaerotignum sp. TaxID=2039241 RepID=UPI0028A8FF4A|nr:Mbeg1-like protein [Anaerotignum sp.]